MIAKGQVVVFTSGQYDDCPGQMQKDAFIKAYISASKQAGVEGGEVHSELNYEKYVKCPDGWVGQRDIIHKMFNLPPFTHFYNAALSGE